MMNSSSQWCIELIARLSGAHALCSSLVINQCCATACPSRGGWGERLDKTSGELWTCCWCCCTYLISHQKEYLVVNVSVSCAGAVPFAQHRWLVALLVCCNWSCQVCSSLVDLHCNWCRLKVESFAVHAGRETSLTSLSFPYAICARFSWVKAGTSFCAPLLQGWNPNLDNRSWIRIEVRDSYWSLPPTNPRIPWMSFGLLKWMALRNVVSL